MDRDTGKKGTPSAARAGMEVNSQVTGEAKMAKSGTSMKQKATRSQKDARKNF